MRSSVGKSVGWWASCLNDRFVLGPTSGFRTLCWAEYDELGSTSLTRALDNKDNLGYYNNNYIIEYLAGL